MVMGLLIRTPGPVEILIIVIVLVLLFGATKIPELARSVGRAKGEFQKGLEEGEEEARQAKAERRARDEEDEDQDQDEASATEPRTG